MANPSRTQELYFVADGSGGHVFSNSLDTHNRNVQRWRQIDQTNKAGACLRAPRRARLPSETVPSHEDHTQIAPSPYGGVPVDRNFTPGKTPRRAQTPAGARSCRHCPARARPSRRAAGAAPHRRLRRRQGPATLVRGWQRTRRSPVGGVTRAENDLDGPASDNAAALDGPAAPVEGSALGYYGAPVNAAPNGKPQIVDASEGTALDPLLDKSWDLNSPKTVDAAFIKDNSSGKGGK